MTASSLHSSHIRVDGLSHAYGMRRVLADVDLTVSCGERVGLIGENGAGKSTLLRLIAGIETADDGEVSHPARTGLLWQEIPFEPADTLDDVLEAALGEVRAIERELDLASVGLAATADGGSAAPASGVSGSAARTPTTASAVALTPADRYAAALDAAERADVWSAEARRDALLDGLGVSGIRLSRRLDEISGGQRSRVALAALLLSRPDALLLDEPTNHLDDAAAAYLESQVREWRGPVVFASHDRAFLDAVATGLVDLDPAVGSLIPADDRRARHGRSTAGASPQAQAAAERGASVTTFGGRFSEYLVYKASERERWEKRHAEEQAELARLRLEVAEKARTIAPNRGPRDNDKFIYKFKAGTQQRAITRRVRNANVRLETLEHEQVRKPPPPMTFAGIPSGSHGLTGESVLVHLADAAVPDRLGVASLHIAPVSRLLVTGANGAGKSTLLAVLAGVLPVAAGRVNRRRGLRIGLLEQDVRFADPSMSARMLYERELGERRAEQVPLGALGLIAPRDENRAVGALSVGQQRRLALALVIARPPHLFLLDEPTNHLSLGLATELEEALGSYPGAVVIASHDRWLRERWDGERLELAAGRVVAHHGTSAA